MHADEAVRALGRPASWVMVSEEVLLAKQRTLLDPASRSSVRRFSSRFSTIASTTRSHSASSPRSTTPRRRPRPCRAPRPRACPSRPPCRRAAELRAAPSPPPPRSPRAPPSRSRRAPPPRRYRRPSGRSRALPLFQLPSGFPRPAPRTSHSVRGDYATAGAASANSSPNSARLRAPPTASPPS